MMTSSTRSKRCRPDARAAFEELRSVIALVPWRSEPASHDKPDGEVRFAPFSSTIGSGFVYFLILEDLNRVDLLELIWIGRTHGSAELGPATP